MMNIDMWYDMWYGDEWAPGKYRAAVFFYDLDCEYRGNIFDDHGKIVGDYSAGDSVLLKKMFKKVARRE